jgi:selenocysteine lyase/cysteine desulfurase
MNKFLSTSREACAGGEGDLFAAFSEGLAGGAVIAELRDGLIGKGRMVPGPFGDHPLVYADYVASGRALAQVEDFVREQVLPFYANSHTEASYCGGFMTRLRHRARTTVARLCGADDSCAVIFAGSGATAGINKLVALFGIPAAVAAGRKVRIILGPYEHHSNLLPWRESGAEVVEVPEGSSGGPDLEALKRELATAADLTVCAISAASNVTGIVADIASVTRMVKAAGAIMVWDYAGGGPYMPVDMRQDGGCPADAVVLSPHKFIGGPAASGVLIVRRSAVVGAKPSSPGGGTVRFVSSRGHDYSDSIETREEAGTPDVVGDIRAALAFLVKDAIGQARIDARNRELTDRAIRFWQDAPNLELLGNLDVDRLPIFAFRIRDEAGGHVHQQLVTRLLSDRFGIQARGGCACAGPYVHRLLDIDERGSEDMRAAILRGDEVRKPGFTRLNLSVLMSDDEVAFILRSVAQLAADATKYTSMYACDEGRAIFSPRTDTARAGTAFRRVG